MQYLQEKPTAREQFVHDYTLVIDNDFEGYRQAIDTAREGEGSVFKVSEKLREDFETYITQVFERERELGHETGAALILELLIGFGSSPFDDIARHYIDLEMSERLHEMFATSLLKTGK